MDWIYGYLAALRHTSIVEAAASQWEVSDYLTAASVLATLAVGYITYGVSQSAAQAATGAAKAAEQANDMNSRARNTEMRMAALSLAGNLISECSSLSPRHRGKEYEIAERIAFLKRTLKVTTSTAHNTVASDVIIRAENELEMGASLLREAAELIPRSRDMLLQAQGITTEVEFEKCMSDLYDLMIACSGTDRLVGLHYVNAYALAMSVPLDIL